MTAISPDRRLAVIFDYSYRGGGVFDLTERWTQAGLLIVNLDDERHICKIPMMPIPHSQLAFIFANDATLIVLNDGVVTAYRELSCASAD